MDITGRFYYSKKAANLPNMPVNKCLLSNGSIEQYTEWVTKDRKPGSKWDDLVYLGEGIIYWHNGVDQVTPNEVRKWQIKRRLNLLAKYIGWLTICTVVFAAVVFGYLYLKGLLP
jgi:hypothetical protein